jgi:wyosine [tRNA(Phe)-imidazoG37] synthetase (radical SAM superfamily)
MERTRDGFPSTGKLAGTFLWERIINGPVRSRRLGLSLGLNILPPRSKLCSFDCPYCECGFNTPRAPGERWPSPDVVADAVRKTLEFRSRAGEPPPDWLTFAGNGEPTLHPRFPVVVERVLDVRNEVAPALRVGILSNGLIAGRPTIRAALDRLDARMMKLDPGPAEQVNGVAYDRAALIEGYCRLKDVVIQAMVVEGPDWSGAAEAAVSEWVAWLARLQPLAVHLYSLQRAPADGRMKPVARERLEAIAERARRVLAGRVEVY